LEGSNHGREGLYHGADGLGKRKTTERVWGKLLVRFDAGWQLNAKLTALAAPVGIPIQSI
jgi:hypothetical protein